MEARGRCCRCRHWLNPNPNSHPDSHPNSHPNSNANLHSRASPHRKLTLTLTPTRRRRRRRRGRRGRVARRGAVHAVSDVAAAHVA
eukprot:scaffold32077_cov39-Phaeocystis_antarctica.AAC.3